MPAHDIARAAVTGLGTLNALSPNVAKFAAALRSGESAIGPLTVFDATGYRSRVAAQVPSVEVSAAVAPALRRRLSRSDAFAVEAVAQALADSAVLRTTDPVRIGVAIGGTTGGMLRAEAIFADRVRGTATRYSADAIVGSPISTSADVVAHVFGLGGPRITIATACSSSANAIGIGFDWLRLGRVDAVVAGGTESLCRMTYAGFNALHAVSAAPCKPFDRRRDGLSIGEGAAFFVLESRGHAERRGARIHGEVLGYGNSADAHHPTAPHPDGTGAMLAMRRALACAGLDPSAIEYVNAHGTGTPLNDAVEARAIRTVFGPHVRRLAVSSTKGAIGHTLGAAGALEALATLLSLRDGFLLPTVNLEEPDPECEIDLVPAHGRDADLRCALSNSYGFGGNNTSVVLGRA
jgi:3-oxoacyl-[acyl-carrier-protein] synthase II